MDAAVQGPASPGIPSLGDPISTGSMDGSADVSLVTFAAAASSHEDEDFKESDRWRLHSDTSTISSRVTTPDPVVSSPPLTPFASVGSRTPLPGRISNAFSPLPLLPPPQFLLGEGRNGVAEEGVAEQGEQVGFCRGARTRLPDPINRTRQNHLDTDLFDLRCLLVVLVWLRHRRRSHCVSSRIGARMATGLDAMVSDLSLADNNPSPPPSLGSQTSASTQHVIQPAPGFQINKSVRPRPSRGLEMTRLGVLRLHLMRIQSPIGMLGSFPPAARWAVLWAVRPAEQILGSKSNHSMGITIRKVEEPNEISIEIG
ncbi:hypothetical protein TrVGV298_011892 [Trichoderma virens]|nr:hypothetical protein TrVGV298_011892 [Trichoderma virens]